MEETVAVLQRALSQTCAAHTARLRYTRNFWEMGPEVVAPGVDPRVSTQQTGRPQSWARAVRDFVGQHLDRPPKRSGTIDFDNERSVDVWAGTAWCLTSPAGIYRGGEDGWSLTPNDGRLTAYEPFWLLTLFEAITTARPVGTGYHHREPIRIYTATTDAEEARSRCSRQLEHDEFCGPVVTRLPLTASVGPDNRIVQIDLALTEGRRRRIELWDFGGPASIELPDATIVS